MCFVNIKYIPPDNGIISGEAVANTLVSSRMSEGCLQFKKKSTSFLNLIIITYLFAEIREIKRP